MQIAENYSEIKDMVDSIDSRQLDLISIQIPETGETRFYTLAEIENDSSLLALYRDQYHIAES